MSITINENAAIVAVTERNVRTVAQAPVTKLLKIKSIGPQGPIGPSGATGASFSGSQFLNFAAIEALDSGDTGVLLEWDGSLFSPSSGIIDGDILQPAQTLHEDVTLGENRNGISVGPVTIASGVAITVPLGATWVII